MSRTYKKKGSKPKQFKGNPCMYLTHIYKEDGVKKTLKKIMKRKARSKNKMVLKKERKLYG